MACASACPRCGFSILDLATIPPFPHPELLVSEAAPTDSEAAAVHAAISTTKQRILAIEEEMERLGRALKECTARRKELRVFGCKQRSAHSLFRRLPHEVLAEVFLRYQEIDEANERDWRSGDLSSSAPKWIVAQVCGRWRAVALSTPRLWTNIKLLAAGDMTEDSFVSLLSLQIERSGELPLSLQYRAPYTFSADARRSILDLLWSFAYRWQEVGLCLSDGDFQAFIGFTGASFPLLSTLKLSRDESFSPGSTFLDCPRLQHLTLPRHPRADLSKFPWVQLKTLRLRRCPPEDILSIIRQMLRIETISLYGCDKPAPNTTTIPTRSETLQSLNLHYAFGDSRESPSQITILSTLEAPALQQLSIVGISQCGPHITGFLARSRCPLTHLVLRDNYLHNNAIFAILALTPELTHLDVDEFSLQIPSLDPLIEALPRLAPRLAFLSFTVRYFPEPTPPSWWSSSRAAAASWIKSLLSSANVYVRAMPRRWILVVCLATTIAAATIARCAWGVCYLDLWIALGSLRDEGLPAFARSG
ncbi:hypothetical protein FB451DRAFT_1469843 [Mycena latifolia]|nr:hypothetical protein FB451DRAFT_1469843 [Mycena latifolia]